MISLATFLTRVATFSAVHNQVNTLDTRSEKERPSLWKKLSQGVVSSVRKSIDKLFSSPSVKGPVVTQHTPHAAAQHDVTMRKQEQVVDIGHTSLRISSEIEVARKGKGVVLSFHGRELFVELDNEGNITEESKTALARAHLATKTTVIRNDFAHLQEKIDERRRVLAPGNIQVARTHFPKHDVLQVEYQLVHPQIEKPTHLLVTVSNEPDAPTYSFPVVTDSEKRLIVTFRSDALENSLYRFIYENAFKEGKNGLETAFHRIEFTSDVPRNKADPHAVNVHASMTRPHAKHREAHPKLEIQEYQSVSIAPVIFPKIDGSALKKAQHEKAVYIEKVDNLLEAWRLANPSVFIEDLSEVGIELQNESAAQEGYLQHFYARFISAGKVVSPSLQAWLLEKLPTMSVSQLHALINFDELLRQEKLGRLFPIDDETLDSEIGRKELLREMHKESLALNLSVSADTNGNTKGMLMGDLLALYRMFHQNLDEQKKIITAYFLNQDLPISLDRWVALVNTADQHVTEAQLIHRMSDEDYLFLEETSEMVQTLYQDRMRLKTLMESYAFNAPEQIWRYLSAGFDNTLRTPLRFPLNTTQLPLYNECLKISRSCQERAIAVTNRTAQLQEKLLRSHKAKRTIDELPVSYSLAAPENAGKNVHPDILETETYNWSKQAETFTSIVEKKNFILSDYNKATFRILIQRGQVIIDSFKKSSMTPVQRKKVMYELYTNFMTSHSIPMLHALQLEFFLRIAMQEPGYKTFLVTQVMLRQYVEELPVSKKKDEILKLFLHIQMKSRMQKTEV